MSTTLSKENPVWLEETECHRPISAPSPGLPPSRWAGTWHWGVSLIWGSKPAAAPLLTHHPRVLSFAALSRPRRLRALPTTHQQVHCHLSLMVSGQIQATIGKADFDIMLFIAGVSVNISNKKPPERICEGGKKRKRAKKQARKVLPWLQTSRHSHFVTCTICSSHAQGPITSFQMVINPLGPWHTCNLPLG